MSERENDDEIEEEGILDHWSHDEHPLILMETQDMRAECYGCERPFSSGEQAYGCSKKKCGYTKLLHKECAEMPRKITHSEDHDNQHILIMQHDQSLQSSCQICYKSTQRSIGYKCTSFECKCEMHIRCTQTSGVMESVDDDDDDDGRCTISHLSHPPNHQLRLFEKTSSFKCDACGITGRGKSYICTSCRYWIHQRCAALPQTIKREDHHHSLSLSFHVSNEYLRYKFKCEVCNKIFLISKYWIYYCEICRYAVHIKCAFKIKTTINNATNEKDIVQLPTDDVAEELIRPFVMRQGGAITPIIPLQDDDNDNDNDNEMVNVKKYKFMPHEHELTLISSSSSSSSLHHHQKEKGEEEEEDSDEYEEDWGKRSELICNGCITPILSSSSSSSDKSSSSSNYYYMSCSECKYNLHLACFNLPPRLPSLPIFHHEAEHELVLISCPKHKPWDFWDFPCSVCSLYTNGLMYGCSKCDFKADVKCASLPHHAAHRQNPLNLLTPTDIDSNGLLWRMCDAGCSLPLAGNFCYAAAGDGSYEFAVCVICAVLPATVRSRRWDRHHPRLPLTYDANLNHPGEFYCDHCERKMNPKSWMYHCRLCDLSFHPHCFRVESGWYRNSKFGGEYTIDKADHPHTLTYQLLTTKRRCDSCRRDRYGWRGFLCASCNFFVCFCGCGFEMERRGTLHPID